MNENTNATVGTKTLYFLIPCDTYPDIIIALKADGVAADVDLPIEPIPCPLQQSCGKDHMPRQITKEEYDGVGADDDYDTYEVEERYVDVNRLAQLLAEDDSEIFSVDDLD